MAIIDNDILDGLKVDMKDLEEKANVISGVIIGQISCLSALDNDVSADTVCNCYKDLQDTFKALKNMMSNTYTKMLSMMIAAAEAEDASKLKEQQTKESYEAQIAALKVELKSALNDSKRK